VYRMDDVPIRLRPALPSRYPSDEEVLRAILRRIRELREAPEPATTGVAQSG
jgi:formylmethanofuran dehydrogenase subunit B